MTKQIEKIDEQIAQIQSKINDPKLCENSADTYSRISGYYRPLSNWNIGKEAEFEQRAEYRLA